MSFAHFQQLIYHQTDLESAASRQVHTFSTCQQPLTSPVSAKFMAHRGVWKLPRNKQDLVIAKGNWKNI